MSEYTPTIDEMRAFYTAERLDGPHLDGFPPPTVEQAETEFNLWLAAHDAEVQAQVVAEEPEWEYGWAWADEVDSGTVHGYHTSSTADERAELSKYRSEFIAPVVDMRRKVTPWVPVKQEGAETDV